MNNITFGELRKLISVTDRLSICYRENLKYKNFLSIKEVPKRYNTLLVCGVGTIESELYELNKYEYSAKAGKGKVVLLPCLEIVTTKLKE